MEYEEVGFSSYRKDDDVGTEQMSNFVAEIAEETRVVDGMTSASRLLITGRTRKNTDDPSEKAKPEEFTPVEIDSESFANLGWVLPSWGVKAIIRPGSGIKDDLRTYIQLRSNPKIKTIYRHTGWTKIKGKDVFIHAGGAISKTGNDASVTVRLPNELNKYNLATTKTAKEGFDASMNTLNLTKKELTWPLLAATLAPMFGPVDFAIHLAGRTGTYKSEVVSIFQSHFGPKMDARNLPGSWSSTANALEAQAFLACNCPFVIDDFVPQGSSWQIRAYQQNADKIIRAQGNQAGRARLTDISSLQQTMYPRGVILSTGEDIPEGHSVRARLLILELSPGDVDPKNLTACQKDRESFVGTTANLAMYLADTKLDMSVRMDQLRKEYQPIGHSRTPSMLARLVCVAEAFLEWAVLSGLIDNKRYDREKRESKKAIETAGRLQMQYLEETDPVDIFMATIRQILGTGLGHIRSMNGGVPSNAKHVGWTEENAYGEMPTFKSRGPCLGWCNARQDELFIDVAGGFALIKKVAAGEITLTKQTMLKRIKDAGLLVRSDDARQRNSVRITADGHPRTVIALPLSTTLDTQEVESNGDE